MQKKRNISFKKPCTVPWKIASKETQIKFAHKIQQSIKNSENSNNVVLYCDACHVIHNTIIKWLWQLKWSKYTMNIKMNSWRDRWNIIWVLEANSNNIYTKVFSWSCNSIVLIEFLYELRRIYKDKKYIDIYLDNARYQKTKEVFVTAKVLWIRLHFLPPYTPNLNLIERIWKRLKWKLWNVYNETSLWLYEYICDILRMTKNVFKDEILKISNSKIRIINVI